MDSNKFLRLTRDCGKMALFMGDLREDAISNADLTGFYIKGTRPYKANMRKKFSVFFLTFNYNLVHHGISEGCFIHSVSVAESLTIIIFKCPCTSLESNCWLMGLKSVKAVGASAVHEVEYCAFMTYSSLF